MPYPTNSADVARGQRVEIESGGGHFVGKVESVLTPHQNFLGVKVRLDNGLVGRVRSFPQARDARLAEKFQDDRRRPEDQKLEFKSSFLFDLKTYERTGEAKPRAVNAHSVAKTVAAFANSDGGTLYVGVGDDGQVLGLERDYQIIKARRGKTDMKFDNGETLTLDSNGEFQTTLYRVMLQLFLDRYHYSEAVKLEVFSASGRDVCAITVRPSKRPLILRSGKKGGPEFYVRHTDQSERYDDIARFCDYWCGHLCGLAP